MTDTAAPSIEPVVDPPLRRRFGWHWRSGLALGIVGVLLLLFALRGPMFEGIGVWGNNIPFVWGFDLTNYAWWIGLANGGGLLAAGLVLRQHNLRTAINRFAESIGLAATLCAAIFPVFHLGRPWLAHWMVPYPAETGLWPQFRSPLTWDFWAILSHLVVMGLFWYVGLIPDLATMRDRARTLWGRRLFGLAALGWRGSASQWAAQQRAHRLLAIAVLPFLFVIQTTVSLEFATTLVPEWHETRQPLHFVVTGFAAGLALVFLFAHALREGLDLHEHIDDGDIEMIAKLVLATALIAAFVALAEVITPALGDAEAYRALIERVAGRRAPLYWLSILLAIGVPQLLWSGRVRRSAVAGIAIGAAVVVGVWLDHLAIVAGGVARGRLMIADTLYWPTFSEILLLVGSIGLFATLTLIFVRLLPVVSLYEARTSETEGRTL